MIRYRPVSIFHKLFIMAYFSLPFTYALTINIGFPLKIYEMLFIVVAILLLLSDLLNKSLSIKYLKEDRNILYSLVWFFVFYLVSTVVGIFLIITQIVTIPDWATGRFGAVTGTMLELGYILLNIFVFIMSLYFGREIREKLVKSWLAGATLASLYSIYLLIYSAMGKIPYKLPGMDFHYSPAIIANILIIRQGTFMEGNFMGGFVVPSLVMAVYMYESTKRRLYLLLSALFFFSILSTVSTISILSLILFIMLYCLYKFRRIEQLTSVAFIFLLPLLIIGIIRTSFFKEVVLTKIFSTRESNSYMADSKLARINQAVTGLKIFCDYPISGVGPGNYGLYYNKFVYDKYYASENIKHIPNNIYVKLLSEGGITTFLTFILFIAFIFLKYFRYRTKGGSDGTTVLLLYGMICIMLILMAYPTLNLTFLWAYFAIVVLSIGQNRNFA